MWRLVKLWILSRRNMRTSSLVEPSSMRTHGTQTGAWHMNRSVAGGIMVLGAHQHLEMSSSFFERNLSHALLKVPSVCFWQRALLQQPFYTPTGHTPRHEAAPHGHGECSLICMYIFSAEKNGWIWGCHDNVKYICMYVFSAVVPHLSLHICWWTTLKLFEVWLRSLQK